MITSKQTPGLKSLRRVSVFAVQALLATTLVACAESESPTNDTVTPESAAPAPAARPENGLQSNDDVNSVSYAQAVAAGEISDPDGPVIVVMNVEDKEDTESAKTPDVGAANPDTQSSEDADTAEEEEEEAEEEAVSEKPQNPFEPIPAAETETDDSEDEEADVQPADNDSDDAEDESGIDEFDSDEESGSAVDEEESVDTDDAESETASTDDTTSDGESPAAAEPDDQTTQDESAETEAPLAASSEEETDSVAKENPGIYDPDADDTSSLKSTSHTTPGFEGEVIDDAIRVTWNADPLARGYNVYRQAQYITTVMTNEYIDTDVFDRDYYYEIQAFDYDDVLYYIATGLTVSPKTLGRKDPNEPVANQNRLDDYEMVFSEEFTGMSLDGSKWNTAYLWGPSLVINSEEQYYVDILRDPDFGYNPFTFDGEYMTINSIETPPELAHKALNQPYLSGVITSYDAFKFTYGYAETRAKVTFGRGYWPAFWLLNAYYGGDDPEIDIMEFIGDDQDVVYHTYHYYDAEGKLRSTKSEPTPGIDFTAEFHTFAVEWKPGTIIYLVDGIEVHRVTDPKVSSEEMYVIANTAIGGWWAGSPDSSTPFPGEYTIDYIRVYQRITPFDDVLLNDGMTNVPFADDIPGQSSPSHRPSPEQWPEGYPYR